MKTVHTGKVVKINIQILVTWPQKMAATSARASAPESPLQGEFDLPGPLNSATLQLKNIYK